MADTISIDVPVFFPCTNDDEWKKVKDIRSVIDIIRNDDKEELEYPYYPSKVYDGFGEYAKGGVFPVNATMVNFSTRSQSPLMTPLFIRSLPWQSMKFRGRVHCKFQPSESINGQVRVLMSESPVSLSAGNITSIMSGTQLSHSFSCSGVENYTFDLFRGEKTYDNALNGMVTPGTISYNEMLPEDTEIVRQYNNRCDMFSAHLLFDSVTTANDQGINAFAPGTKIGTLTFTFALEFVVARGSAYSQFLQDSFFRIIEGHDIGTGGGVGPTPPTPGPTPEPEEPTSYGKRPIPYTAQNVGQNAFEGMLAGGITCPPSTPGSIRISRNVAIKSKLARPLFFKRKSKFAKAVIKHYCKLYAGGRMAETDMMLSDLVTIHLMDKKACYSTGYVNCGIEGNLVDEEDAVQKESLVKLYPSAGPDFYSTADVLYDTYNNNGFNMVYSDMETCGVTFQSRTYVVTGKKNLTETIFNFPGYALDLYPDNEDSGSIRAAINFSQYGKMEVVEDATDRPPVALGTTLIIPGSWTRKMKEDGTLEGYSQYALTGFCSGCHINKEDNTVAESGFTYHANPGVKFEDMTFNFDDKGAPTTLLAVDCPAPETLADSLGGSNGWLSALGAVLSAGASVVKSLSHGGKNDANVSAVPLEVQDWMSSWNKSKVGDLSDLAKMSGSFFNGPYAIGLEYGVGQQTFDEKGRFVECCFSATFNNCATIYTQTIVDAGDIDEMYLENAPNAGYEWTKAAPGDSFDLRDSYIALDDAAEPHGITFREFLGDPKFFHCITPIVSLYQINEEHFAECCVMAAPIGDNTVTSTPITTAFSLGNNIAKKEDSIWSTHLNINGINVTPTTDYYACSAIFITASNDASVRFTFCLPEELPEFNAQENKIEMKTVSPTDKIYVYFQVSSQLFLEGHTTRNIGSGTRISCIVCDGLTGKQPNLNTTTPAASATTIKPVGVEGNNNCPFLILSGVKTSTSFLSSNDSTTDVFNPDGKAEAEPI